MSIRHLLAVAAVVCMGSGLTGCGKPAENKPAAVAKVENAAGDHSGWWCNEHGVPEEVCALCSTKLIPGFKDKGDWCTKHDRPDSQCFACHPDLQAKFAETYVAKYGKQPPKPTDNGT